MGRLFGTDGVRGRANGDLSADLALRLAAAAAEVLVGGDRADGGRPVVVVGRDTRPSGEMLEAAVAAGLASAGADVELLGVVPTPAVAFAAAQDGVDLGVMITASHNPMPDNGIKFFAAGGHKLPDEVEDAVEAQLRRGDGPDGAARRRPTGAGIGRVRRRDRHRDTAYADHLLSTLTTDLTGLRVVVDCAEGAAVPYAPAVYRRAGAEVVALNATGDGYRINDGSGATHLEGLQAAVVEHGADVGIAHDGDADRCLAVDATGAVVDGDQVLGVLALALQERGALPTGTVVATVMSNLGLHHALRDAGIGLVTTPVGDRYVLEAMRRDGHALGGEQSGHLVLLDHATTGDGLLTALQLLDRVAATGRPLADLAAAVRRLPQVLVNVPADRSRAQAPEVLDAVAAAEARLGDGGRVLLRPSGTEPLVRVMVEAGTEQEAAEVAEQLAGVVAGR